MNFRISKLSRIIPADEDVIRDAARIFGYRLVGPLLCLSGVITPEFIREVQLLQQAKDAMAERRRAKMNAQKCFTTG